MPRKVIIIEEKRNSGAGLLAFGCFLLILGIIFGGILGFLSTLLIFLGIIFIVLGIVAMALSMKKKDSDEQFKLQQQQQQQIIQVNVPSPVVQPVSGTELPRPPSIPPTDTIFCIHCGSQNFKYAKFCKVCGATIE